MEGLNSAFFFVADKLIDLQQFFMEQAWIIAAHVLTIAILSAAINYALTGQGLKENIIKIGKAFVFFWMIMWLYPHIIGRITQWTFEKAHASTYVSIERYLSAGREEIASGGEETAAPTQTRGTWARRSTRSTRISDDRDPSRYFSGVIKRRTYGTFTYTVVAPAAALEIVLLVAGECIRSADEAPKVGLMPDFGRVIKGLVCGFFVIFAGILAVLEYLMAFLEFILVTGVGIILFPLSLWEGSKFMAEKLIGAIIGFFVKLLFCNICVFLLLYGFMALAKDYAATPFTGRPDEIVVVIFTSLLFFFLSKSAPALAQSLLTGTPSLSAAGAIGAAAGAIGAARGAMGLAGKVGKAGVSGLAKTAVGAGGMLKQANKAAETVRELGGTAGQQFGAFMTSMSGSAKDAVLAGGHDLMRSLLGGGKNSGGAGGGGAAGGINPHSQRQKHLADRNTDGTNKTLGEFFSQREKAGEEIGLNYMVQDEQVAQQMRGGQNHGAGGPPAAPAQSGEGAV